MKIVILDDYQDQVRHLDCFTLLAAHQVRIVTNSARGIGQLAIRLRDAEVVVLIHQRTAMSAGLLRKLPNLRLIALVGSADGQIDRDAATECGVAIANGLKDPLAPAELTWALVLAASRRVTEYAARLQEGVWQGAAMRPGDDQLGRTLAGRCLGILGYGRVGKLVAAYGKAFRMRVVVWSNPSSLAQAAADGFETTAQRNAVLIDADVLCLHLSLTDATRHAITEADLALMKSDALLVNTGRAELIAPGALEAALAAGRPGSAALDVFESEPLASNSSLLRRPNLLATPHLGAVDRDSYERDFRHAFGNILAFAAGTPRSILNSGALAVHRNGVG